MLKHAHLDVNNIVANWDKYPSSALSFSQLTRYHDPRSKFSVNRYSLPTICLEWGLTLLLSIPTPQSLLILSSTSYPMLSLYLTFSLILTIIMTNIADMTTPFLRDPNSPIPSIESDDAAHKTNSSITLNSTSISRPSVISALFSGIINLGGKGVIPLLAEVIDLDIDEAEIERLKVGAGANHKRLTLSLLCSKQTSSPLQTPFPTNITEEERFVREYRKRRASEGFRELPRAKRQCAHSSSTQFMLDYEAQKMPSRSPEKRRKHLHNTGAKLTGRCYGDQDVIDLTQSLVLGPVSVKSEVPDAEDPQGNSEEAYTARRVKINSTTPLQRSCSESKLLGIRQIKHESPGEQPYAIAPPENEDEDRELLVEIVSVKRIKPENISKGHSSERQTPGLTCSIAPEEGGPAVKEDHRVKVAEESSESNAHEKERSIEVKGAPRKDWAFRRLLEDATQFFDYGNVEVDAKVENEKRQASMVNFPRPYPS
ncbi:hypothetical protein BGZ60DRAFT_160911 [Tricladium varicosporioides]|nr:hypothetical protein BGZ60DRAFT_160911 [Hymenoscyphus varicosporioides]